MSAPPGAKNEYSRGSGGSGLGSGGGFGGSEPPFGGRTLVVDRGAGGLILAGTLLAALLLIVAEFTALYEVHVATSSLPIKTVSGGHNHHYAMLVIGMAAAGLGITVWRLGSRTALVAVGILGVVALVIALVGDLPDSHATGLTGSPIRGYVNASSTPSAGLYMETLGAVLLIAACGLGLMLLGVSFGRPPGPGRPGSRGGPEGGRGDGGGGRGRGARRGEANGERRGAGDGARRGDGNGGGSDAGPAWSRRKRGGRDRPE